MLDRPGHTPYTPQIGEGFSVDVGSKN